MYRQGSGARQSVHMGEMTPRRIKDFVFVHFNAFKSLMDRDMGLREEGWGTGEGRREGPCGCWSWRRKEKKKKKKGKESQSWGTGEGRVLKKNRQGEFRRGWKDEKQRMTSEHQTWFRAIVTPKGYEHTNAAIFQSALLRIVIFYSSPLEELNLAHHHNTISLQKSLQTSASSSTSSVRFRLNQSVKWKNERRRWQKCLPK